MTGIRNGDRRGESAGEEDRAACFRTMATCAESVYANAPAAGVLYEGIPLKLLLYLRA